LLINQISTIESLTNNRLSNLKVATQYGCHALYPPAVDIDHPKNPISLDKLISATGAEIVDYKGKLDCCGSPLTSFNPKEANYLLQYKLQNLENKVDCIVTTCPACFFRFDVLPNELKSLAIPVLHISEFLCLALGVPPQQLYFKFHKIDVQPLIKKIGKGVKISNLDYYLNLEALKRHCGACRKECSAAVLTRETTKPFDPLWVIDELCKRNFNKVIKSNEIWRCIMCGKCELYCPNNLGLKTTFLKLRGLAVKQGIVPESIDKKKTMFEQTGYTLPIMKGIRKKLGIEPLKPVQSEINKILEERSELHEYI
jgi:heterodisulfide reductase subunit C